MNPDYIDIHSHLNFAVFSEDREEVIKRTLDARTYAVNVGTQRDTSRVAVELARAHEGLFAIVGLHPIHTGKSFHDSDELGEGGREFTSRGEEFDYVYYRDLAQDPKVIALGECGLDYFRAEEGGRGVMEEVFRKHIELAREVGKPLMLHVRNGAGRSAYQDAFSILKSYGAGSPSALRCNLHFFAGSKEEAKPFLDVGSTFSFTGVITFARTYNEIIKYLPPESIMAETDAPYVAPEPHRGKRNEPRYVAYVVERIARIRGVPLETMRTQILENVKRVFGIPAVR